MDLPSALDPKSGNSQSSDSSSQESQETPGRLDSSEKRRRKERSKTIKKAIKRKQKDKKKLKKRDKKARKKEKGEKAKFENRYGKLDGPKEEAKVPEKKVRDSAAFRKEARQMFQKMAATIDLSQTILNSSTQQPNR